eukprot:CAMPEP_0174963180 /NCGR_PEP_ID=MMETSP0004_2-20121128/5182_1 /TAXON_ID=420556 /ORGANISM="Ochromonas sp., Strain CCMP1393" /LENGTH=196 /DNA_ID=CAMNT_0016211767 /DNA_START=153 /DNA_END=743 /DNA_ORIENTATION=+
MSLARQSSSQQGLSGVQDLFEDPVTNGLGDTGELSLVSTWSDPEQFVTGDDLACTSDLGALAGGGKASLHPAQEVTSPTIPSTSIGMRLPDRAAHIDDSSMDVASVTHSLNRSTLEENENENPADRSMAVNSSTGSYTGTSTSKRSPLHYEIVGALKKEVESKDEELVALKTLLASKDEELATNNTTEFHVQFVNR